MIDYYLAVIKKYAVFEGRSRRSEYWYFALVNVIISVIYNIIISIVGNSASIVLGITFIYAVYSLALIVPGIAVSIRRMHDIGKKGWWLFINLIPIVGPIWFIVLLATGGNTGDNQYGHDPKNVAVSQVL